MKNFAAWRMRAILALALAGALAGIAAAQVGPEKDYLSGYEADKIRDAETPNEKIKLFIQFADDRLKKFQYELEHPSQTNHTQQLNYLMNSYIGCVDDAADLMQEAAQKQQDQLLDDQPAAVFLLRLEQELHRRPADALVAHAVDQVDDDRGADQGGARHHERRVEEEVHASGAFDRWVALFLWVL